MKVEEGTEAEEALDEDFLLEEEEDDDLLLVVEFFLPDVLLFCAIF